MPEKLANSATQFPILGPTRRVWMLAALICVAMLMIWSTDQSTVANLIDVWRYPKQYHPQKLENSHAQKHNNTPGSPPIIPNNSKQGHEFMSTHVDSPHVNSVSLPKNENPIKLLQNLSQNVSRQAAQRRNSSGLDLEMHSKNMNQKHNASKLDGSPAKFGPETAPENLIRDHGQVDWDWVQIELEPNYSSNLLARWLAPGGEPCRNAKTAEIKINEGFDDANPVVLSTGTAHVIVFQALDESGTPRCSGGDYFEIEFSGELWKSRPPLKDLGNGSYSFTLQIHPDFAGIYNLSIILLFRHFEGLKYSPTSKSDFNRDVWAGRWTRHARNDSCDISDDGRYRCLQPDYPCSKPWCHGSLGLLESNGWVYSAHCSFKLFAVDEAWKCLNSRWLFLWGDSNHVDTVRNILFFFLGVPQLEVVTRRFDKNFMNPKNESQFVRITNIFNGHWDMKGNYLGLDSLINQEYRDLIKSYFNGSTVPDTVIFNSGLHDGVYWPNIRRFVGGAARAAAFWEEVMKMPEKNGLGMPNFIFRSTVATGGYARLLAFNPSKIEAFNAVLLEKLRAKGIVSEVIDDFDMTWAWHFDNRCNDGVHYGRFPAKLKWKDGRIGHQYFVDLMLGHVLLNAICSR